MNFTCPENVFHPDSSLCVSAELKEAVRTWPHSDPVSWAQRTTAVALVKRLDQSFDKAVAALQQNDPKYYQGETTRNPETSPVLPENQLFM